MDRVAVIGGSMTRFGKRDAWLRELLAEAGSAALEDAGVAAEAIEHLYVSNMAGGLLQGQTGLPNGLASDLGAVPAYTERIEHTSASGASGVYAAWRSIASGASEMTLLAGGEKMTHRSTPVATDVIASLAHPVEHKHGATLTSFAGLATRQYLTRFDAPRESLARVSVKNHHNGTLNPNAQFQTDVDVETVMESKVVADPLRLYDYCPISDGGSALVFCPESVAREYTDDYVVIPGIAGATDTHVVHEREDLSVVGGVVESGRDAFEMADRSTEDVDVAELHDSVTLLELLLLEGLGFADRGDAWRLAMDGETELDGSLPVNPSGGLKAKGHPLGATGVAQVYEIYEQLLGEAGDRQVDGADVGVACNVAGFGNAAITTVLEAAR
jgi:acetyl-CoA C-acetyltransferase